MDLTGLSTPIRRSRTSDIALTATVDGRPVTGAQMAVRQTSHRLLFGSNWGDSAVALANGELEGDALQKAIRRNEQFLSVFNFVTLPFYWAGFEPVSGQPATARLLNAAKWYRQHGCAVKGHPLCWHTLAPDWLLSHSNEKIRSTLLGRIKREVTDFAGLVDAWDVVNEAVIMPVFDKYDSGVSRICRESGAVELIRQTFAVARATDPRAVLVLNDFDISPEYEALVERCLNAGIRIDAIGVQAHMHQGYWGVEKTLDVLERFARFGLPIQFTETTLLSGELMPAHLVDLNDHQVAEWPSTKEGEARQTEEAVQFYQTLIGHPAVNAITWWDFVDGAWLNAPAGLLRRDLTPKPAFMALRKLIKQDFWLPETKMQTDEQGLLRFTGFLGDYEVTYQGRRALFSLDHTGPMALEVSLG